MNKEILQKYYIIKINSVNKKPNQQQYKQSSETSQFAVLYCTYTRERRPVPVYSLIRIK